MKYGLSNFNYTVCHNSRSFWAQKSTTFFLLRNVIKKARIQKNFFMMLFSLQAKLSFVPTTT